MTLYELVSERRNGESGNLVLHGECGGVQVDAEPVLGADSRAERSARLAAQLARAKSGDLTALDAVVEELNPLLWHVARSQGLTSEDAADAVQNTWLELVRQLNTIRSPAALTAWLITTTRREAWRTNARHRKYVGGGSVDGLENVPADLPEPDERLSADERLTTLWRHFGKLSDRCRALLRVIAHADRPDYASIAKAMDMPHGSIGPTRGRCLAKLREMLLADPSWGTE
jgi:RNA polymerase sigma factor (sigma-70 family)